MKKLIALLLALAMIPCLVACNTDSATKCNHTYADATCMAPKTCKICGTTEGEPADHLYQQGVCTVCSAAQPNYLAWAKHMWRMDGLTEDGTELDRISLNASSEEPMIGASFWGDFDTCDEEFKNFYLTDGEKTLFEFEGKQYYSKGFGSGRPVTFEENGDTVVITVMEDEPIGTLTLVRISGNQYKVTEVTGRIVDSVITGVIQVGSVFTGSAVD